MAAGDEQQTAAEEIVQAKDPGVVGVTAEDQFQLPYNPSRIIDLNDTTTLANLEQESTSGFERAVPDPVFPKLPKTVEILRGPNSSQVFYKGEGLIDENNRLVRLTKYIPNQDINDEFFRVKNKADRNLLFTTMQKLGYYGDRKPSLQALEGTGLTYDDRNAMESFMFLANSKGRTMRALVDLVAIGQIPSVAGVGGTGRAISVVSREDAAKQTGNTFFELLGRAPTEAELKTAIQAIQSADRERQLSNTEDPAALSVAAEEQTKKASPGEFAAYSAGKAVNQIFSLLGGQ